jgi:hypothetical protein
LRVCHGFDKRSSRRETWSRRSSISVTSSVSASARSVPGGVTGITIAVAEPDAVSARWATVGGGSVPGCRFVQDDRAPGIVEIELQVRGLRRTIRPAAC